MAETKFFDTEIHCKDGIVFAERSLLWRVSAKFEEALRQSPSPKFKLHLPEEIALVVMIFVQYLAYLAQNYGMNGPSLDYKVLRDFKPFSGPDASMMRLTLCGFLLRNGMESMISPFASTVDDPEEAVRLASLVEQNFARVDDAEEVINDLYANAFNGVIRRQLAGKKVDLPLNDYKTIWKKYTQKWHTEDQATFVAAVRESGYDAAELEDRP